MLRLQKLFLIFLGLVLTLFFSGLLAPTGVLAKNENIKLKVFVHYPKNPGKPLAASSCDPTTNAQVNDYLWAGWQMPTAGMTYKINYGTKPKNLTNTQVYTATTSSFATWATADADQIFNYAGATSVRAAKYDGTNAILFKGVSGSAIAITYVWYYPATGLLAEADTAFNKNYKWTFTPYTGSNDCGGVIGTYDLQNIGTHEFGHWIGLDDLYNASTRDLTMYGYGDTQELKKDSLGRGDISGVRAIAP